MNIPIRDILFVLWGIFCCLGWLLLFVQGGRLYLLERGAKALVLELVKTKKELARLKGEPDPTEIDIPIEKMQKNTR